MKKSMFLSTVALAAMALVAVQPVKATTVVVLGAGSSAMWTTAAIGAWKQLAGANAQHYTIKGTCTSGNCAQLFDSRNASILKEGGNLWVVWSADFSKVWAYLSVDSVLGNRAFFAVPRAQLQIDSQTLGLSGQNLISTNLWGNDATALPSVIYNVLNNAFVTTAFTDIRPEDAKMAQCRIASTLNAALPAGYYGGKGLGYGTGCDTQIPSQIFSSFTTASADPVAFNIKGTDPFTGLATKAYTTISVGAAPITFLVNKSNLSGLGAPGVYTNITSAQARTLFTGTECDSNVFGVPGQPNVPVTVVLREPLSGTMNTTEYTVFRTKNTPNASQESGINLANPNTNPLNLPCTAGGGSRKRGIGTGEVVKNGVKPNADSIGYAFFSYGNIDPLKNNAAYGYLTLNGVDPINATYSTGLLPDCNNGTAGVCPAAPGTSFPNIRNGTYASWSVLRVVTDASGVNLQNTRALVNATQNNVNSTVPDFVPVLAIGGDPGLKFYRSHFAQAGTAGSNGLPGTKETGGDAGGCIEPVGAAPGILNCHQ